MFTQQIKELVKDTPEIVKSLKYVRDAARVQKELLETEEKFPMALWPICAVIEQDYLKPHGDDQGAHHGGDLNRPSVYNLMSKADIIFGGINEFLLFKTLDAQEA